MPGAGGSGHITGHRRTGQDATAMSAQAYRPWASTGSYAHVLCTTSVLSRRGAAAERRRASRRRGPRRSWVERPYIGASVRWEHRYTDRLATVPSASSICGPPSRQLAGSPRRPKTRSRRRKPRRELCVARMRLRGRPVVVLDLSGQLVACSLQLAASCQLRARQPAGRSNARIAGGLC